jgi:hypothetical protein
MAFRLYLTCKLLPCVLKLTCLAKLVARTWITFASDLSISFYALWGKRDRSQSNAIIPLDWKKNCAF